MFCWRKSGVPELGTSSVALIQELGPVGLGGADGSSFSSDPIGTPRRGLRWSGLGRCTLLRAAALRSANGPIPTLSVRLCAGRAGPIVHHTSRDSLNVTPSQL